MMRFDVINAFIQHFGYKRYLEIGVNFGDCISRVNAEVKDGVDPAVEKCPAMINYPMTSDQFFESRAASKSKYDLIFIDGLHQCEQVSRDLSGSMNLIANGGSILLHDCNPPTAWHASENNNGGDWNGTVYQAVVGLRLMLHEFFAVGPLSLFVIDTDWGIGVVRPGVGPVERPFDPGIAKAAMSDFAVFDAHRESLLNLVSVDQFKKWLEVQPRP